MMISPKASSYPRFPIIIVHIQVFFTHNSFGSFDLVIGYFFKKPWCNFSPYYAILWTHAQIGPDKQTYTIYVKSTYTPLYQFWAFATSKLKKQQRYHDLAQTVLKWVKWEDHTFLGIEANGGKYHVRILTHEVPPNTLNFYPLHAK